MIGRTGPWQTHAPPAVPPQASTTPASMRPTPCSSLTTAATWVGLGGVRGVGWARACVWRGGELGGGGWPSPAPPQLPQTVHTGVGPWGGPRVLCVSCVRACRWRPSSLTSPPNRAPRLAVEFPRCDAHAQALSVHFGARAAEERRVAAILAWLLVAQGRGRAPGSAEHESVVGSK
jgi:hypothetical protein